MGAPGLSRGARGVGGVDSMRGVCAAQSVRAARGRLSCAPPPPRAAHHLIEGVCRPRGACGAPWRATANLYSVRSEAAGKPP